MPKLRKTLPKEFTDFCFKHVMHWTSEDMEQCKTMLEPCDPNACERGGYKETALHKHIPLELVEWLVARGADVNAPNTYGTPIFEHAYVGNYEICKFLVEHGADLNVANYAGHTVLFSAAAGGNCDIVRLLLEYGADPCHHSENWDGNQTSLLYLLSRKEWKNNHADIAELLIRVQKKQGGIPSDEWMKAQEYVSEMGHKFELCKNDMSEDYRREAETAMNRYYAMLNVTPAKPVIKHDGKSPIEVDESLSTMEQYRALWEFLVPASGKCVTMQGEVIRIIGRIDDESNRNGGANWDIQYRKMIGALAKYFLQGNALSKEEMEEAQNDINEINNCKAACVVSQNAIDKLMELAVKWVIKNPKPVPLGNVDYNR